jgi:hypothetical protein
MRVAFVEGVGGGVGEVGPDGTVGAEVDLAAAVPTFDLLSAREQVEEMMLTNAWEQDLTCE